MATPEPDWRDLLKRYMRAVMGDDHIVANRCVDRAACDADLEDDPVALRHLGAVYAEMLRENPGDAAWFTDQGLAEAGLTPETIAELRALDAKEDDA